MSTKMTIANLKDFQTIHTYELLQCINEARAKFGEKPVRNNDFLARVEDDLEGDELCSVKFLRHVEMPNGGVDTREINGYNLTLGQALYVGMRESKGVRCDVYEVLKGQEERIAHLTSEIEAVRNTNKEFYKVIAKAVDKLNEEVLKEFHYVREADLLNVIVFGHSSKELRELLNSPTIRDYIEDDKLKQLEYLQRTNTTLIELGMEYKERKGTLEKLFKEHYK